MNLSNLKIVYFRPVEGLVKELPDYVNSDLSCDQRYLHGICLAVQNGHVSQSLASRSPGTLNHARWLTLANRLLLLYVSTLHPAKSLLRFVTFIVNHYASN